ncbi:MAG TPA: hypothetical protein VN285_11220 [Candidatus Deferrimicrobium sp.]|nr:hypothetical protein [Candidatus Deferrimicrobium sp.]
MAALTALCLPAADTAHGARTKEWTKKPKKEIVIVHSRFVVGPKVTAGLAAGKLADTLQGAKNTLMYGAGVLVEYCPRLRSRLGLSAELASFRSRKFKFEHKDGSARMLSFGASYLVLASPRNRSSLYGRVEFGYVSAKLTNPPFASPHAYPSFRMGLGHMHYSGARTATRLELYYKRVYTADERFDFAGESYLLDFNASYFALEFSLTFSL